MEWSAEEADTTGTNVSDDNTVEAGPEEVVEQVLPTTPGVLFNIYYTLV